MILEWLPLFGFLGGNKNFNYYLFLFKLHMHNAGRTKIIFA